MYILIIVLLLILLYNNHQKFIDFLEKNRSTIIIIGAILIPFIWLPKSKRQQSIWGKDE